jgi:hypothetical protein
MKTLLSIFILLLYTPIYILIILVFMYNLFATFVCGLIHEIANKTNLLYKWVYKIDSYFIELIEKTYNK